MNPTSLKRITDAAEFLGTPEAWQCREYLADPLQMALEILEAFGGSHATYEELSEGTGKSVHTVQQVIRALEKGGYPFSWTITRDARPTRGTETGRLPKAISPVLWKDRRDKAIELLEPLTRKPQKYDLTWKAEVIDRATRSIRALID